MTPNLDALQAELVPIDDGRSDAELAEALNARTVTVEHETLSASEVWTAIDEDEFAALSEGAKALVQAALGTADPLNVRRGSNARTVLFSAFGAETRTRSSFIEAVQFLTSPREQIGWPRLLNVGDILEARHYPQRPHSLEPWWVMVETERPARDGSGRRSKGAKFYIGAASQQEAQAIAEQRNAAEQRRISVAEATARDATRAVERRAAAKDAGLQSTYSVQARPF